MTINNSTITGNSADNGGGINNSSFSTLNLNGSIVANNTAASGPDIAGPVSSGDYNLIKSTVGIFGSLPGTHNITGVDPVLGPLQNNGGPTETHALLAGSPAIDKGKNFTALTTDQRGAGYSRSFDDSAIPNAAGGDATDIGAYELLPPPEINVKGNGVSIADGDTTPSAADNTIFASPNSGLVLHTFTIENLGTTPLSLTGTPKVQISGAAAADFIVTAQPASPVSPTGSTTFTIQFVPTALGSRTATVSIANDDADENPYDFNISGDATCSNITVTSNGDSGAGTLRQAIADVCPGGTISFANGLSSPITLTSGALVINKSLTIMGPVDSMLGIQRSTAGGTPDFRLFTVNGGQSLTLANLTLANGKAADGGAIFNSGTLTINNCALTGNSCTGNGGAIASFGGSVTLNNTTLSGNSAVIGGGGIYSEALLVVTPARSQTTLAPSGGGMRRAAGTVNVGNSIIAGNSGTNPDVFGTFISQSYNLIGKSDGSTGFSNGSGDIVGTIALPIDPGLAPLGNYGGPTLTHALLGGSRAIDKGSAVIGITTDQRGQARPFNDPNISPAAGGNDGDIGAFELQAACGAIQISPASLSNGPVGTPYGPVNFSPAGTYQASGTLPPGLILSAGGVLSGTPTALGTFNFSVTVVNASVCVGTQSYSLTIQALQPEINVKGNNVSIADGDTTPAAADDTDFGGINLNGGMVNHTFTIENTGNINLNLNGTPKVSITGANAAEFTVVAQPASPIAASGTTTFTIQFVPGSAGLRAATVSIANDDSDENPYDFAIQGIGVGPEINVKGNSVSIADGDTTPSAADNTDFGSVGVGALVARTFTIENTGNANLNLTGTPKVSITGANFAEFTATTQPASLVAPGGTTTFTIQFAPIGLGLRTATVSIANDDVDENPYNFSIAGTGACFPSIAVTSNGDSGAGTLRQAIADVCPGGTITFAAGLTSPITLTTGNLVIAKNLTITGPGASTLTIQRSPVVDTPQFRIFNIGGGSTVTISGLTISGGNVEGSNGGGAIFNGGAVLTINNCTISGNSVSNHNGGGVYNNNTLIINNSNISGNTAASSSLDEFGNGGGIYNTFNATLTISNSTISGNSVSPSMTAAAFTVPVPTNLRQC